MSQSDISKKIGHNKNMNHVGVFFHIFENDLTGEGRKNVSNPQHEGSIEVADRLETPKMYKVMLLNDDFTPMDFVVLILRRFFGKDEQAATAVMLDVHKKGVGTAGVYTLEIAEMKMMQVNQFSRMNQHPLKCAVEPE